MPQDDQNYIIFLHGFLGGHHNFDEISSFTKRLGYHNVVEEYSTFSGGVDEISEDFIPRSLKKAQNAKTINIVTHSMGALLLRSYLSRHKIPNLGRVVMISPPNHGSEVADKMSQYDWWVSMFGGAGMDLRTSVEFPLMPDDVEFGIIAGTASWNYFSKDWIKGVDDGWVGEESTKLEGMSDFITVESSHGLITENESAINQTAYFLAHGHFASNIEMEESKIDVNDLDEWGARTDRYVNKINAWYEKIFKQGDEKEIETAREQLADQSDDMTSWLDRWHQLVGKDENPK